MMRHQTWSHLVVIAALFTLIHGALLIHGLGRPEAFLAGDRAEARLEKIEYVFFAVQPNPDSTLAIQIHQHDPSSPAAATAQQSSLTDRLVNAGTPGDYVFHGMLYAMGGKPMVTAVQLLLFFVAMICSYKLALMLGCRPGMALAAVVIYMLLPGSLILPHQLASESLYNPLVVIGLYLVCNHHQNSASISVLLAGLCLMAVAIAVRLPLALYPFLLAPILAFGGKHKSLPIFVSVLAVSFFIPATWAVFVRTQTGQMQVKSHDNNPALEFFKTAKKMSVVGGFEFDESAYPSGTMPMEQFLGFIAEHPAAYARLKAMHVANLAFNPGIYSLAGHHLGLLEGAGDTSFWKDVRNREGYWGLVREIIRRGPVLALVIALSLAVWGVVLIAAACGLVFFLRSDQPSWVVKAVLVSFALYSCLIVQVSTDVRWGHRTPIEFLIAILSAIALQRLWQRRKTAISLGDQSSRVSPVSG